MHLIAQLHTFDARYASDNEAIALLDYVIINAFRWKIDVVNRQLLFKLHYNWYQSTLTELARQSQRVFLIKWKRKLELGTHGGLVISISSCFFLCVMHNALLCYVKANSELKTVQVCFELSFEFCAEGTQIAERTLEQMIVYYGFVPLSEKV